MKIRRLLFPFVFAIGFVISCTNSTETPFLDYEPIDISQPWEETSPKSVSINASELNKAINEASKIPRLRSLLVIRNSKIVSENYFASANSETLHDVRSVTKSVIATLTLIALERGDLPSLDKTICLGDEYQLSSSQQELTFRHLLTMTSGIQWDEWTNTSYNDWVVSIDEIQHMLDLPFTDEPGTAFTYNSGAVHMLGYALEQEIGMSIPEYAEQELFGPLGIEKVKWQQLATGVNGGSGIDLRTRGLARIGQLYLQEGLNADDELLTPASVADLTNSTPLFQGNFGTVSQLSYGFLWWTVGTPYKAFMAWGYGGQYIIVIPELKMVVVTTTDWGLLSAEGGSQALETEVMNLVFDKILAAAK